MLKLTLVWQNSDNYMYLCTKFRNPPFLWNPLPSRIRSKKRDLELHCCPQWGSFFFYPVSIISFLFSLLFSHRLPASDRVPCHEQFDQVQSTYYSPSC